MKLIWLSDLHFEFLTDNLATVFIKDVAAEKPDAVVITGDLSNASRLENHLTLFADVLPCPVYFVLGNHDFYLGSFAPVEDLVANLCARNPHLIELGHGEIISIDKETALIGHRGWADGRAGLGSRSTVRLNDHQYITDLRQPDSYQLFAILNRLGDESADYVRALASRALEKAKHLFIATHVPPFVEAALYSNRPSDPAYAPHFVNLALGRAIQEMACQHPDKFFTVLCGHTHHRAIYSPSPNIKVEVAGAEYRYPQIAGILTIP